MSDERRREAQAAIARALELLRNAGTGWVATWEDAGVRFPVETLTGPRVHTMRALASRILIDLRERAIEIGKLDAQAMRPIRVALIDVLEALNALERAEIEAGR